MLSQTTVIPGGAAPWSPRRGPAVAPPVLSPEPLPACGRRGARTGATGAEAAPTCSQPALDALDGQCRHLQDDAEDHEQHAVLRWARCRRFASELRLYVEALRLASALVATIYETARPDSPSTPYATLVVYAQRWVTVH